jgi:beta-lactam-binding protein with PASTA domain
MLKTFIRTTACLAMSATAFIVITNMDATAAKPRSPSVPDASEPKPTPPKMTVASVSPPPGAVPSTAALRDRKGKADRDSTVTVPDWKGKRLSVARREARRLGLTVTALDGGGAPVPPEEASEYRVRKQSTTAGTEVEPGTDVELRVRMIVDTAMGY